MQQEALASRERRHVAQQRAKGLGEGSLAARPRATVARDDQGTDAERAFDSISERVRLQLTGEIPFGSFSCVVLGVEWGVLVDSIVVQDGDVVGANEWFE